MSQPMNETAVAGLGMRAASGGATAVAVRPLRFSGVFRSEWIKATSLRSVRWTSGVSVFLVAFGAAVVAFSLNGLGVDPHEYLTSVLGGQVGMLSLVFAILGVFLFSSEYASGMIISSLTVVPRRGLFLAGKAAVVAALSAIIAGVCVVISAAVAAVFQPDALSALFSEQILTGMLGSVIYLVCIALLGFGIAGMLRSTAGSITAVVLLMTVLPTVLMAIALATRWTWPFDVLQYLPGNLGSVLGSGTGGFVSVEGAPDMPHLSWFGALACMLAWTVASVAGAAASLFVRDAK